MERVVLAGLSALRWAAWAWMAAVLAVSRHDLLRPWLALSLVGAALAYTIVATVWLRVDPARLLRVQAVAIELGIAAALVLCDGWAYGAHHAFSTSQSLGSVWPLAAVLSAGVALNRGAGAAAGALLGAARLGAVLANGVRQFDGGRILSLVNTAVFYAVAGAVAGHVVTLMRRAEAEISAARAREEVARTLHDGVLQTLAVVERRSTDEALVRLAREQDRELRAYLFGDTLPDHGADLGAALRRAAARFEDAFGIKADVFVPDDAPALDAARVAALSGAVGEALANAGKHGRPTRVTVYVEPGGDGPDGGGLFCSVKDDGAGFDVDAALGVGAGGAGGGFGISRSIMERMAEVGGRAEVRSTPGHGTEVCLWLP
jgi:signal transduction histidine kinase